MKFELNVLFQSLSFKFLVKVWARSWMLKFYVEIGSLAQRLKFEVRWTAKFRSWGLKLKLELDAKSWASNLKLRWSLTSNIWSTVFCCYQLKKWQCHWCYSGSSQLPRTLGLVFKKLKSFCFNFSLKY